MLLGGKGYIYFFNIFKMLLSTIEGSFPTMTLELNPDLTPLKACHPCF